MVLVGAAVVAALLGERTDAAVVGSVVIVNSLIGFFLEFRAGRAIEALSAMVPQNATAIREGKSCIVPAAELVPGFEGGERLLAQAARRRVLAEGVRAEVVELQIQVRRPRRVAPP